MSAIVTVLAASEISATPYIVGMALGFLVGSFGHLIRSHATILFGIALLGATVTVFVVEGLHTR